jgi:hypothetical protein
VPLNIREQHQQLDMTYKNKSNKTSRSIVQFLLYCHPVCFVNKEVRGIQTRSYHLFSIIQIPYFFVGRDSVVVIETGYGLGERFSAPVQTGTGTHPTSVQLISLLFPGRKEARCKGRVRPYL